MPGQALEELARRRDVLRLSLELARLNLGGGGLEIKLEPPEGWKSVVLLIHSRHVLTNIDGKRVFRPDRLMELEEYVRRGLREYRARKGEAFWALLIGLTGVVGLLAANLPELLGLRRRARIKRWLDEEGNLVYMASGPGGLMIPLLKVNRDGKHVLVEPALALALRSSGYYLVKLTYPEGYVSWEEAVGLEADPRLEVVMEPGGAVPSR